MRIILFIISLVSCFHSESFARWADKSEHSTVIENIRREIYVNKDGTFQEQLFVKKRVNNEEGKEAGNFRMTYNSANSEMDILQAIVINNGVASEVKSRNIEDKAIPSSSSGTDKMRQLVVNFQDVQVGSQLEISFRKKKNAAEIPGYFRASLFMAGQYIEKLELKIESEIPLYFEKNDPTSLLEVSELQKDNHYFYQVSNKAPVNLLTKEETNPYFGQEDSTYVLFSSAKTFSDLGERISPLLEEKYEGKINPAFSEMIEKAKSIENADEQINFVTNWIIGEFRYMKDYQKENSGNVPRDIDEILRTRFGDCKDFSLLTSYALRKLGYKAFTAWVFRGYTQPIFPVNIAYDPFNHAIVKAEKDGKTFWIDATNRANYARGIFTDIANRQSLVLDPAGAYIEKTFAVPAEKNARELKVEKNLSRSVSKSSYKFLFKDNSAIPLTSFGNRGSKEELKYQLLKGQTEERSIISSSIMAPDLKSRNVEDISIELAVEEKNQPIKSTVGLGMKIPTDATINSILAITPIDRVSGLQIGNPSILRRETKFKGIQMLGKAPVNCKISNSWISAERKVLKTKDGIKVEDFVKNLKMNLTAKEIQSAEFSKFQDQLSDCFQGVYVIYKKKNR